ncbi:expressed unknown protein [Ectocarpus siliculosus]|uniref:Uncharacterized protein n=1 Tax=Ectocarpus siliculosus TaxID=2880 RepID=D8LRJ9_ECTSI|nr:expressed unknown protein [Ectocarpus siliculosus]|eukprot:CBN77760.1 expressed unknown protein [Ectocarpus siliculosus]
MADLQEARREYAVSKSAALSTQLQEISVAKFEVEHSHRQLYAKRGNLLYLTPRPEVKAKLEASEKGVGERLAKMQKAAEAAAAEAAAEASEPAARR